MHFYLINQVKFLLSTNPLAYYSLKKSCAFPPLCFVHKIPCTWKFLVSSLHPLILQSPIQILSTLISPFSDFQSTQSMDHAPGSQIHTVLYHELLFPGQIDLNKSQLQNHFCALNSIGGRCCPGLGQNQVVVQERSSCPGSFKPVLGSQLELGWGKKMKPKGTASGSTIPPPRTAGAASPMGPRWCALLGCLRVVSGKPWS